METPGFLTSTQALLKLKLRLLKNSLLNWGSFGKLVLVISGILAISWIISMASSDMISGLRRMPFGEDVFNWLVAMVLIYFTSIVFTGDLLTGHSLNTGQISTDFAYLNSLPIPSSSLIFVKLVERLLTDYLGFLILFSGFIGLTLRDGFSVYGIILSAVAFAQISLVSGLFINLLLIVLKRFFRTTAINNFFSILAYISGFITLVPYFIFSNFPVKSFSWLLQNLDQSKNPIVILIKPFSYLADALISVSFNRSFLYWSGAWASLMIFGSVLFAMAIKQNWLTFSQSASRRTTKRKSRWFSGFFQKEVLLMKSDLNLLVNAVMMPISIIILEIYFLKDVFNLNVFTNVLNILFGSIIYFCMFGPMNSTGSEGKAISFIETLPISSAEFLKKKFFFWFLIAQSIFVPATIFAMRFLNFNWEASLKAGLNSFIFVICCVWVSISLSTIFARFESKILQQKSSLLGKAAAMACMLIAIPIKDLSYSSLASLCIFILIGSTLQMIAQRDLFFRLDKENFLKNDTSNLPTILLLSCFIGLQFSIKHFFISVAPFVDTGLWHWFIASLIFIPTGSIYFLAFMTNRKGLFNSLFPKHWPSNNDLTAYSALTIFSCILIAKFSNQLVEKSEATIDAFANLLRPIIELGASDTLSAILVFSSIFLSLLIYDVIIKRCWLQKRLEMGSNVVLNMLLCALLSVFAFPAPFMIFGLFTGFASTIVFYKSRSLFLSVVFNILTIATFFYIQIF